MKKEKTMLAIIGVFISITLVTSCSSGDKNKKENDQKENLVSTDMKKEQGAKKDTADFQQVSFNEYKLTRAAMKAYEGNPKNAKLLLLKIKLDDLSEPTSMTLWAYPAKDHKHYAENENPDEIKPEGNPILLPDTKNMIIGNNELDFKKFHVDENFNKPWLDFTYIILSPYKKADGNLIFKITAYKGAEKMQNFVPAETNPSPPAPPAEN